MKRIALLVAIFALLAVTAVNAQPTQKPLSWQVFGGYTPVAGKADDGLEAGWGLGFGVTWRPNPGKLPLGLRFDTSYDWWDAKNVVTQEYRVDNGYARSWSVTADLVWESQNRGPVGFYGGVGIGGYGLYAQLTNDVYYVYCDPWYWWCWPTTGQAVQQSDSTIKFGYNALLGLTFRLPNDSELALETQYNWVQTKQTFEYYPIRLAYRW